MDSAKNVLNGKKSVLKAFVDSRAELDAKTKAVNDAVSAKVQEDQDSARQQDEQARSVQAQTRRARASSGTSLGSYDKSRRSGSASRNFQTQPRAGRQG